MPSFVMTEKCDGCKGQDKTACMYICPNDLMMLNKETMKGYNQEPQLLLGVLLLCQDMPAAGYGCKELPGLCAYGRCIDAAERK